MGFPKIRQAVATPINLNAILITAICMRINFDSLTFLLRFAWLRPWMWLLCYTLGTKRANQIIFNRRIFPILKLPRLCYVRKIGNGLVQSRYGKLVFLQPVDNLLINDEIFYFEYYEKFRRIVTGDVVVDVGAHVGTFGLKAGCVASRVVSVEPSLANFKILKHNLMMNRMDNVIPMNFAASDTNSTMRLYNHGQSGMHSITERSDSYVEIESRKLDDVLTEQGIDRVDFLKIDAEGAEPLILLGAAQTINKHRPFIAMEYHSEKELKELKSILRMFRYNCTTFRDRYIFASYPSQN